MLRQQWHILSNFCQLGYPRLIYLSITQPGSLEAIPKFLKLLFPISDFEYGQEFASKPNYDSKRLALPTQNLPY
jgi:hypothetical protein